MRCGKRDATSLRDGPTFTAMAGTAILSETVPILITILHCSHARQNAKYLRKMRRRIKPAEEKKIT